MNQNKEKENNYFEKKVNELTFDDKIDDSYTNKIIDKYKQGHKPNKWFIASGMISIIFGLVCFLVMAILGISFLAQKATLATEINYESRKKLVEVFCIILPLMGIASILVGFKILKFSHYSREQLMKETALIVTMGFVQMFVSGFVFCLLTFGGYFVGRGIDYGAIYYNKIEGYTKSDERSSTAKEFAVIKEDIFGEDEAKE